MMEPYNLHDLANASEVGPARYYAGSAQQLVTTGQDLDCPDRDLSYARSVRCGTRATRFTRRRFYGECKCMNFQLGDISD